MTSNPNAFKNHRKTPGESTFGKLKKRPRRSPVNPPKRNAGREQKPCEKATKGILNGNGELKGRETLNFPKRSVAVFRRKSNWFRGRKRLLGEKDLKDFRRF